MDTAETAGKANDSISKRIEEIQQGLDRSGYVDKEDIQFLLDLVGKLRSNFAISERFWDNDDED